VINKVIFLLIWIFACGGWKTRAELLVIMALNNLHFKLTQSQPNAEMIKQQYGGLAISHSLGASPPLLLRSNLK
jgi:hypothetical protein